MQAVLEDTPMYEIEQATRAPALIPDARMSTAAIQASRREVVFNGRDAWQTGLQEHLLSMHCYPADPQTFKCNAVIANLCGNRFAELRVDASRLQRRDVDTEDGTAGPVKVLWQLAGRSRIHQGPNSSTLDPGSWTICDTGREYVVDFDHSARCILIMVPRKQCTGWLSGLHALAARALAANGPAHIAKDLLSLLLRDAAELDGRSERALHDSIVALVEQGLKSELERRGMPAQTRRSVDSAHVQSYVLDHVADKGLSVERVAATFGMSRRSLYNLFAPLGVTPHAFIQSAKLDRAGALLSDGGSRDVPVVRIAEQCGFNDAAHFSRAFHARFGASPNVWRGKSD
jgi:AraC family transcriptional regulator, positive regulator of tynA and feaB